jgi:hypothetical protein
VYFLDGRQGDGTVNATIENLLICNNALLGQMTLNTKLASLMFAETTINYGEKINYGMGWLIKKESELGKTVFHGGSWPGYPTYNSLYLEKSISIIPLCNQPLNLKTEQEMI